MSITVRFRCREDFTSAVSGMLLMSLREIAGEVQVAPISSDPFENPLAVVVRLGDLDQLEDVSCFARAWLSAEWGQYEKIERIVAIETPSGVLVSEISLGDSTSRLILVPEDAGSV